MKPTAAWPPGTGVEPRVVGAGDCAFMGVEAAGAMGVEDGWLVAGKWRDGVGSDFTAREEGSGLGVSSSAWSVLDSVWLRESSVFRFEVAAGTEVSAGRKAWESGAGVGAASSVRAVLASSRNSDIEG